MPGERITVSGAEPLPFRIFMETLWLVVPSWVPSWVSKRPSEETAVLPGALFVV